MLNNKEFLQIDSFNILEEYDSPFLYLGQFGLTSQIQVNFHNFFSNYFSSYFIWNGSKSPLSIIPGTKQNFLQSKRDPIALYNCPQDKSQKAGLKHKVCALIRLHFLNFYVVKLLPAVTYHCYFLEGSCIVYNISYIIEQCLCSLLPSKISQILCCL